MAVVCTTCKGFCTHNRCTPPPLEINGCAGCAEVTACLPNNLRFCLLCEPTLGRDATNTDVSKIEVYARYQDANGQVMPLRLNSVDNPANFSTAANKYFELILSDQDTALLPIGTLNGEVYLTTAQSGRYKLGTFCIKVQPSPFAELAPPVVEIVTSCNYLELTLDMANSDVIHTGREFCEFLVDWGDGSPVETVSVEGLPSTGWTATYEYAEDYAGDVTVTGVLCFINDDDLCEDEVKGSATVEVNLCAARLPIGRVSVTSDGVIDTTASFPQEEDC